MMPSLSTADLVAIAQVILTDLTLAADNAIVIGMAAAPLAPAMRRRAIMAGIAGATLMRVVFAVFVMQLLKLIGLLLAGGMLLLWVSWKLWRELPYRELAVTAAHGVQSAPERSRKSFGNAVTQIVVADVSMSLDNVLAVAGVARDQPWILVLGLVISIALMGSAATVVAKLLMRHSWVAYLGLLVIVFVSADMIWDGARELMRAF